jgi:hypothetical protein
MERSDNRLHTERSLGLLLAAALGAGVALALAAAAAGAGVGMALLAFASTAAFGLASDGRSEAALRRFRGPR